MSAPAFEFQKMIYDALSGDAAISAVVTGVFDNVPEAAVAPYLSFGPADETSVDAEGIRYSEHVLQVDIWSAKKAVNECKNLAFLVKQALHKQPLAIVQHAISNIRITQIRIVPDPDGAIHGILTVHAIIEER